MRIGAFRRHRRGVGRLCVCGGWRCHGPPNIASRHSGSKPPDFLSPLPSLGGRLPKLQRR
jgi:hypothetical protein